MDPGVFPLFPLPLVLFPGTGRALHIFEPRYRQLLHDINLADGRFVLLTTLPHTEADSGTPLPGTVGCVAKVVSQQGLADGRSNLIVIGEDRCVLAELVDRGQPYFEGRVDLFDDREDEGAPEELTRAIRRDYAKLLALTRHDLEEDPARQPDTPRALSFHVASDIDVPLEQKEALLRMTSVRARLDRLRILLHEALDQTERQAAMQQRARGNGQGAAPPSLAAET